MSNEYHSILINKLESKLSEKELTELLYEIGETQEPIFIHRLHEIYKTHKSSTFSHIIIGTIGKINSPRKVDIAKEILAAKETKDGDLMFALNILENTKYYDIDSLAILKRKIPKIIKDKNFTMRDFLITDILSYFENAKSLDIIDKELQRIYKDPSFGSKVITLSLKFWVLNSPSERTTFLVNNYSKIKKKEKLEKALSKISTELNKKYATRLMKTIRSYGSVSAKSTLQFFQNSIPVREIVKIKDKINRNSRLGVIGQDIFGRDKDFDKQLKPASSKNELEGICNSLRASLQDFNPLLRYHGLSDDKIKKILRNSETNDYKKSINIAELYLYSKGIVISEELGHLRKFNRLMSIILHPEKKEKLKDLLVEYNLSNEYENQNWEEIHYKILGIYLDILKSINKKIEHP